MRDLASRGDRQEQEGDQVGGRRGQAFDRPDPGERAWGIAKAKMFRTSPALVAVEILLRARFPRLFVLVSGRVDYMSNLFTARTTITKPGVP